VEDLREEFARDFIYPAFPALALNEGRYLLAPPSPWPLIAKRMVEIARPMAAQAVAHGATGKGNDQVRFELTAMAPGSPAQDHRPLARVGHEVPHRPVNFAKKNGIPVPVTKKKPWSIDANLLHVSFEGGELEDP
jgi:argininosuccinate synthase